MRDHLDDRADAASLLADAARPGTVEADLGGSVGTVAELVLEPVDVERVALAVGQDARDEVAGEPAGSLRGDEERVAHRRRAEPLVAAQRRLAVAGRPRDGLVRAHVGAALALGQRHPAERACFLLGGTEPRVVARGGEARHPLVVERGLLPQRRERRERHRKRAADAGLDLGEREEAGRACDVYTGARVAPGRSMQRVLDAEPEQLVPGGVELDLVDPVAEAVVGAQLRRVLVREPSPFERLAAEQLAEPAQRLVRPAGALARDRLDERPVLAVEVVALERRRLVPGARGDGRHGVIVLRAGGVRYLPCRRRSLQSRFASSSMRSRRV